MLKTKANRLLLDLEDTFLVPDSNPQQSGMQAQVAMAEKREERRNFMQELWSQYGDPDEVLGQPLPLKELCSACFGNEPRPDFVAVCFDACMQHKNLGQTKYNGKNEFRDKRLFVCEDALPEVDSSLSKVCITNGSALISKDTGETTCSSNFKAASDAKTSFEILDTGVVAACCRHDVVLRLHNMRKSGERLDYAYRLLNSILADPSCQDSTMRVIVLYDIGCKFKKYLKVI